MGQLSPFSDIDPGALEDLRKAEPPLVKSGYLPEALRSFLSVEGTGILSDYDEPKWAEKTLISFSFFRKIWSHYNASANIERSPRHYIVRRNITIPHGLICEIDAVRHRLATSDPDTVGDPIRLSFSGFLEIAARELLRFPIDIDDARFPEYEGEQTLRGLLEEYSSVGPRRSAPSIGP